MSNKEYTFDYSLIPLGFYDDIARQKKGMRSFWHYLKFQRIIDFLNTQSNVNSIIDYGCFCGTLLGMVDNSKLKEQVGLDILEDQIDYAQKNYQTEFRNFQLIDDYNRDFPYKKTDSITIVEVIEHLELSQTSEVLDFATKRLNSGGFFMLTTPNYLSFWPVLEVILNAVSEVNYKEQHITKFNFFNIEEKLRSINPIFSDNFELEFVTTSHFLTPFIAPFSFKFAEYLSKFSPHNKWQFPFGNIIMICFKRK